LQNVLRTCYFLYIQSDQHCHVNISGYVWEKGFVSALSTTDLYSPVLTALLQ